VVDVASFESAAGKKVDRRLTAILAADVVGYSRLMGADEAGTLAALNAHRKELIDVNIAEHQGRLVKLTGDGLLVEFPSVVNAVTCAAAIQRGMADRNAEVPAERRIEFRIGINLGDVIVEGADIFGDGVNIAARLERIAQPGGIAVSGTVRDHIGNRLDLTFDDLGEQTLKNIEQPVRIYQLSFDTPASQTAKTRARRAEIKREVPSIAVLPFTNMSGDPEQDYFSDGVTEDIITELGRFRELIVIARNSSFRFRGETVDAAEVGGKLGAHFLVEGSVRKAGNRVRVTAQLIEVSSGNQSWAERYDRNIEDIFAVQDEVVSTIVATLIGRLVLGRAEQSRRKSPQLWEAHDYFLQARERLIRFDPETAAPLLRRAIELDPTYAQARSLLAQLLYTLYSLHGRPEDLEEGLQAAQRAVELDSLDSRSHCALGLIYSQMRQYDLAGVHFDRAVSLNPNDVPTSILRGLWLGFVGRGEEAFRSLDADLRRDPYPPAWYWGCRGVALLQMRRHAEALEAFQHTDRLHWWMHCYIASCQAHLGRIDLAKIAAAEVLRLKPNFSMQDLERSEWWRETADLEHLKDGVRKAGLG
jgi:TolB-like protein